MRPRSVVIVAAGCLAAASMASGQGSGLSAQQRGAAFDRADVNHDGKLSHDEFLTTPRGQAPNDPEANWQASDKDHDGFVSRQEFIEPMTGEGIAAGGAPASPPPPDPNCEGACRQVGSFVLRQADGQTVNIAVNKAVPWMTDQGLIVVLADGVPAIFHLEEGSAGLTAKFVAGGPDARGRPLADGEIRLTFVQAVSGAGTQLVVENKVAKSFHFDAVISPVGLPAQTASTCASLPNVLDVEAWPGPVVQIVLNYFSYDDRPGACWNNASPAAKQASSAPTVPPRLAER